LLRLTDIFLKLHFELVAVVEVDRVLSGVRAIAHSIFQLVTSSSRLLSLFTALAYRKVAEGVGVGVDV
jgi:hypothetical protein